MMRRHAMTILVCTFLLLAAVPAISAEEQDYSMTYSVPSSALEMIFDGEVFSVHPNTSSLDPRIYWYDNGANGMRNLRSFTSYDLSYLPTGARVIAATLIVKPYLFRLDKRMGPFIIQIEAVEYGDMLDQDPDLSDGDQSDFGTDGTIIGEFTVASSVSSPFEYNVTSLAISAAEREIPLFQIRCSKGTPDNDVSLYQEVKFQLQLEVTYSVTPADTYGLMYHTSQYCLRTAQVNWDCVSAPTQESPEMSQWHWSLARFHLNNARRDITPFYTIGQVHTALYYMALLEEEGGISCQ